MLQFVAYQTLAFLIISPLLSGDIQLPLAKFNAICTISIWCIWPRMDRIMLSFMPPEILIFVDMFSFLSGDTCHFNNIPCIPRTGVFPVVFPPTRGPTMDSV